jgi:hypothetical protein
MPPGEHPENNEIRERVPTQAVGTVHATRHLAGREQPTNGRLLGVGIHT